MGIILLHSRVECRVPAKQQCNYAPLRRPGSFRVECRFGKDLLPDLKSFDQFLFLILALAPGGVLGEVGRGAHKKNKRREKSS